MKKSREKTVLITGGAGFIGQAVARQLEKSGYIVWTFDIAPFQQTKAGRIR